MKLLLLKMPCQKEWIIETDCSDVVSKLEMKYGKYVEERSLSLVSDIKILKRDETAYLFIADDLIINSFSPIDCVDHFLFEHQSYDANIIALHGAAVALNGKCYVFLASTTGGKTTLTSYLTSCGYSYVTDDCVLLDRISYQVVPFSVPLSLRRGGIEVLKKYNALPKNIACLTEQSGNDRCLYMPLNSIDCAVPLGQIFFLERTEAENVVLSMTANEKMVELLKSPITPYQITMDYLGALSNLSKAYCKRLKYCDMNFVKEVIERYES